MPTRSRIHSSVVSDPERREESVVDHVLGVEMAEAVEVETAQARTNVLASVRADQGAVDPARFVAAEQIDHVGDVLGRRQPPERVARERGRFHPLAARNQAQRGRVGHAWLGRCWSESRTGRTPPRSRATPIRARTWRRRRRRSRARRSRCLRWSGRIRARPSRRGPRGRGAGPRSGGSCPCCGSCAPRPRPPSVALCGLPVRRRDRLKVAVSDRVQEHAHLSGRPELLSERRRGRSPRLRWRARRR